MTERIAITEDQMKNLNKINRYIEKAINSWVGNNNSGGMLPDHSDYYYNKAEKLLKEEAEKLGASVEMDRGVGLYPCYTITRKGKKFTQYSVENFFKEINGFWDF